MKTKNLISVFGLASILLLGSNSMAQQTPSPVPPPPPAPQTNRQPPWMQDQREEGDETDIRVQNLNDDQKAKIKDLRIAHLKEMQPLRNKKRELEAKEETLATSPVGDIKAINANIDEITKVDNQMMKSKEFFRQQVRLLLTEEQRLMYDAQSERKMNRQQGPGMRHPEPAREPMSK
jgi:Spy/CpxP family protein refolding chaperone